MALGDDGGRRAGAHFSAGGKAPAAAPDGASSGAADDLEEVATRYRSQRTVASGEGMPQPIDVSKTGPFERIGSDEGAVFDKDGTEALGSRQRVKLDPKVVAILVVGAAAVIALGFFLFAKLTAKPAEPQQEEVVEQTQSSVAEPISYRGNTYALAQADDGSFSLVVSGGGADSKTDLGKLAGTPVAFVLYDGAFVVPENLSDGTWDVAAYTIGSGWSVIVDQDGNECKGSGTIRSASLAGSSLEMETDSGTVSVALS
ncbi:hypothetical protein ACTND8_05215 [Atopobiaceae bacterium HCP3S3_F7]